jgi:hypothetical protein
MIKPIANWDSVQASNGDFERLEAGGYVIQILNVKQEKSSKGSDMLVLFYDIAEGESQGYFKRNHDRRKASNPEAKWQGIHYMILPAEGQSEDFRKMNEQRLKALTNAVEESNSGYKWNWDETTLKGKMVGGLFGREEYKGNDGEYRWSTKLRFFASLETIRTGKFNVPKDKPAKRDEPLIDAGFTPIDTALSADNDLPF